MPETATRPITIVTACMRSDGLPHFAMTEVTATQEQIDNGIHYYLAESELLMQGLEEPFVHFDQNEAPSFLLPAVRRHLAESPLAIQPSRRKELACPV